MPGTVGWTQQYQRGSIMFTPSGDVVIPTADNLIAQRQFTLEGYTLEEQIEEIHRIRSKQKKEYHRVQNANRKFVEKVTEAGILNHVTNRFGNLVSFRSFEAGTTVHPGKGIFGSDQHPSETQLPHNSPAAGAAHAWAQHPA